VRFSPDGQYILAQEDFRITVLTQRPFRALFRIPAEGPSPAEFTPDSGRSCLSVLRRPRTRVFHVPCAGGAMEHR